MSNKHVWISTLLGLGLLLTLTLLALGRWSQALAVGTASTSTNTVYIPLAPTGSTATNTIYVPLIARMPLPTVFGLGISPASSAGERNLLAQAQASLVRGPNVQWSQVEPNQGQRDWSTTAALEQQLRSARGSGIAPIVIVQNTPAWAQQLAGTSCGPIRADKLAAFGDFMYDLVRRYSQEPYNVRHWELWNEPDIDPTLVGGDSPYGCWGNNADPYYGGGYYAEMLKAAYPRIKAADPNAQVLVGGLLLSCNPAGNPDGCKSANFLEGILRSGGANAFDGISFHAYDYYQGALGMWSNANWQIEWNTTGPSLIVKSNYIRQVLSNYGVQGKFLMNTEAALLCDTCTSDATFETTKAYYLVQSYASAVAQGLKGNLWYSVRGWRNSALVNGDLSPRPAYLAFRFMRSELRDSRFVQEITSFPGVRVYEFNRGDRRIWVVWSLNGQNHQLNLPGTPLAVFDALGVSQSPTAQQEVHLKPLYLEWAP